MKMRSKFFLRIPFLISCCLCCVTTTFSQHPLDKFLSGTPTPTKIGTSVVGKLNKPVDLDFSRVNGRKDELWVLNRDLSDGSSMSIYYHAGMPEMITEKRKDSHRGHFMINCSAFAMSDTGDFTTTQEVLNSVGNQSSTFMGPVLWSSDTSIFARINQNNWVNGQPLGSHLDMLHQSPYSMGVAFEKDNIYWVFDGYNKNLCRYDFNKPHQIGGDDHEDGKVWRYTEVVLTRKANLPSHMVIDQKTGWLYIVDNGKKRVLRVDVHSGEESTSLSASNETLEEYWKMKNVKWEIYIDSGLVSPCGIDVMDNRLVVTDNSNGDIILYSTDSAKGVQLGKIKTGYTGIMGVKIGPDTNIWYVNYIRNEAIRLTPDNKPSTPILVSPANNAISIPISPTLTWSNIIGAISYKLQVSDTDDFSRIMVDSVLSNVTEFSLTELIKGAAYYWRVQASNSEGYSQWSPSWNFTTINPIPELVSLVYPSNLSNNMNDTVSSIWRKAKYALSYNIQVSHDLSFIVQHTDTTLTDTSLLVTKLEPNLTYYWRVRSVSDGGYSSWSDTWQFTRNSLDVTLSTDDAIVFLYPSYPNPASQISRVTYTVDQPMHITLTLMNAIGQPIRILFDGMCFSGTNVIDVNVSYLPSEVYTYRLQTSTVTLYRQFVLLSR